MTKIRIKTTEEFMADGIKSGTPASWAKDDKMEYLKGSTYNVEIDHEGTCCIDGWGVFKGEYFIVDEDPYTLDLKNSSIEQVDKQSLEITDTLSYRGKQWVEFSSKLLKHIEEYTVPQYGDYPYDQAEQWTDKDCVLAINKYASRFGQNSRPGQEGLDLLKMAHYACLAESKLGAIEAKEEMVTISKKEYETLLEQAKVNN